MGRGLVFQLQAVVEVRCPSLARARTFQTVVVHFRCAGERAQHPRLREFRLNYSMLSYMIVHLVSSKLVYYRAILLCLLHQLYSAL